MVVVLTLVVAPGAWAQSASKSRPGATNDTTVDDTYRYEVNPAAMAFAREVAARRQLDEEWVIALIGQAKRLDRAIRLVTPAPSGKPKNWTAYRNRFIEPTRIEAGKAFWVENREVLRQVEQNYGVPASLIVGVLGVETLYGRHTGGFRIIDALVTLGFDFPEEHARYSERRAFFRGELEEFLVLAHRSGLDPATLQGSYAGAMGWPQFMPSSFRRYGVDFDNDGKVDLFNSPADIAASVANYFRNFGWRPGVPTHYDVQVRPGKTQLTSLLAPDIVPSFSPESMERLGASLSPAAKGHDGPLALIELENGEDARTYYAGTDNFFAVTRYNWSSYYALAVIELGKAIEAQLPPA